MTFDTWPHAWMFSFSHYHTNTNTHIHIHSVPVVDYNTSLTLNLHKCQTPFSFIMFLLYALHRTWNTFHVLRSTYSTLALTLHSQCGGCKFRVTFCLLFLFPFCTLSKFWTLAHKPTNWPKLMLTPNCTPHTFFLVHTNSDNKIIYVLK